MLLDIAMIVLFIVLGIGALMPVWWAWSLIVDYWRRSGVTPPITEPCPKVAVILCLRGADPSLDACLHGLVGQDYPQFRLQIVVDNIADRAWSKVHEILATGVRSGIEVQVEPLAKPCATCSLKVCAQLQAVTRLEPEADVIVLIDADSIPAPDWLRAMVLPLADPKVGAATGIRWFAPVDAGWGSLIRHIYNAGSAPQMHAFDYAWGGSLAIRADVFRRSSLKKRWDHALCEDGAVTGPLREMGLKLVFVPAATNTNLESIRFDAALRFVQRQLLCVRLDHCDWPRLLAANMFNTFSVAGLALACGSGIYLERWDWAGVAAGLIGLFAGGMFAGLNMAEYTIRRNYRLRGLPAPPMVWTWRMLPAFLLTQAIAMYYFRRAQNLKQVAWRGIKYAIQGPGNIRMEKYEPYQPPEQAAPSHHSTV